jgi:hypothetical protein
MVIPTFILKAVYAVLNAGGAKDVPRWVEWAKIESDPGSDLFIIEASDGVCAISLVFSLPTATEWGGVGWVSKADIHALSKKDGNDALLFLSENPPSGFPEDMSALLRSFAESAAPEVDINLSAHYWHTISRSLTHLSALRLPIEVRCKNPIGPMHIHVVGGGDLGWIDLNLFVMGLSREDGSNDSAHSS